MFNSRVRKDLTSLSLLRNWSANVIHNEIIRIRLFLLILVFPFASFTSHSPIHIFLFKFKLRCRVLKIIYNCLTQWQGQTAIVFCFYLNKFLYFQVSLCWRIYFLLPNKLLIRWHKRQLKNVMCAIADNAIWVIFSQYTTDFQLATACATIALTKQTK